MSLREIADHVAARRREVEAAREAGEAFWRSTIEEEIPAALGTVVVDAGGNLLEVRLNRAGLRIADPRTVGDKVMAAVHAAEARAAAARDEHIHRWTQR